VDMTRLKLGLPQMPFADSVMRHPIFRWQVQRLSWGAASGDLWRFTRHVLVRAQLLMVVIWLLAAGLLYLSAPDYVRSLHFFISDSGNRAVGWLVIALLPAGFILDFVSVQAALRSISGEVTAGRWDLLCLTALNIRGITHAKHAVAQLQTWRAMLLLAGARFAVIWLSLLAYYLLPVILTADFSIIADVLRRIVDYPIEIAAAVLLLGGLSAIYIIEPYWRMRTMTALGMTVSVYVRHVPLAGLVAIGLIGLVWLAQLVVLVSLLFVLSLFLPIFFVTTMFHLGYLYLIFSCLMVGLTLYGFYNLVKNICLHRVTRRLERMR
jgi:hypothetical protein